MGLLKVSKFYKLQILIQGKKNFLFLIRVTRIRSIFTHTKKIFIKYYFLILKEKGKISSLIRGNFQANIGGQV